MKTEDNLPYTNLQLEDLEGEIWQSCYGFDGLYEVSNLGRIKGLRRQVETVDGKCWWTKERIMKQSLNKKQNVLAVRLSNKIQSGFSPHRLVAMSFIRPVKDNEFAIHKNKNGLDNRLENIIIDTKSESSKIDIKQGIGLHFIERENPAISDRRDYEEKFFVYENKELIAQICTRCFKEQPLTEYTYNACHRNRVCKCCTAKASGVVNYGAYLKSKELASQKLRVCHKCKEVKGFDCYHLSSNASYGISSTCKDCQKKLAKIYNDKNKEKRKIKYQNSKKQSI